MCINHVFDYHSNDTYCRRESKISTFLRYRDYRIVLPLAFRTRNEIINETRFGRKLYHSYIFPTGIWFLWWKHINIWNSTILSQCRKPIHMSVTFIKIDFSPATIQFDSDRVPIRIRACTRKKSENSNCQAFDDASLAMFHVPHVYCRIMYNIMQISVSPLMLLCDANKPCRYVSTTTKRTYEMVGRS